MADPSLALQGAIVAALKQAPAVAGGRVYDDVPPNPSFPYVSIGRWQSVGDDNSCHDATELFASVDVWSKAVGRPEARTLAALVKDRMDQEFTIAGFKTTEAEFITIRDIGDPDGKTSHLVVEYRYLIDHDT